MKGISGSVIPHSSLKYHQNENLSERSDHIYGKRGASCYTEDDVGYRNQRWNPCTWGIPHNVCCQCLETVEFLCQSV
jgi:hypothetical protein